MTRNWRASKILIGFLCGLVPAALAAEHPGQTVAGQSAESKAVPKSSISTATPQTMSAKGSITTLDLKSTSPSLNVTTADGKAWMIAINPTTLTIWKDGQLSKLDELKVGDEVKVRYTEKNGKKWAKSIEIAQASKPAIPAATPAAITPAPVSVPATGAPAASVAPEAPASATQKNQQ